MITVAWVLLVTAQALAADPCPLKSASGGDPPPGTLSLQVIQIDSPDRDPLDSAPDIYGTVKIGGTSYSLPEKPDTRRPTWGSDGTFEFPVPKGMSIVPIDITVWDDDPTSSDDQIWLGPIGRGQGRRNLHLDYDVCAGTVSGDIGTDIQAQALGLIRGPGGDEGADILLKIGSADGVPLTGDDVAIMSVDLVQVVPNPIALVAGKPTVLSVTVGNSWSQQVDTTLTVSVNGGGVNRTDTFPVSVAANKSASYYFYVDSPLVFGAPQSYVSLDLQLDSSSFPGGGLAGGCRARNDRYQDDGKWKVQGMTELKVVWVRTGAYGDTITPQPDYDKIYDLGTSYMLGIYPLPRVNWYKDPGSFRPMLTAPVSFILEIIEDVMPGVQLDLDPAPATLIWELGVRSGLSGVDRVIGVLPDEGWLAQYESWQGYAGLSLSTNSRAVIILPKVRRKDGLVGLKFTLPAHELGHTFGLSVQPALRERFWCKEVSNFVPIVGALTGPDSMGCGMAGGMDEQNIDDKQLLAADPDLQEGWPASGIWLAQGGEAPEIVSAGLLNQPQCDRRCLMGSSIPDQLVDWGNNGKWIDRSDYDRLFIRLTDGTDPEVLFVSAIIGANGKVYLGPWFHLPEGTPDLPADEGFPAYSVRFYDGDGTVIGEDVIRTTYVTPIEDKFLPVTFLTLDVPWRAGTTRIDLWDRTGEKALATRTVSANAPTVQIESVGDKGKAVQVKWAAHDADGDEVEAYVETSTDGEHWWPSVGPIHESKTTIDPTGIRYVRVAVHDGIHTGRSEPRGLPGAPPMPAHEASPSHEPAPGHTPAPGHEPAPQTPTPHEPAPPHPH